MAFVVALLQARGAVEDQGSFDTIAPQNLEASLQKNTIDSFMHVSQDVRAEGWVFCANMSKHFGVTENTVRSGHENICPDIAEELDWAWSLAELYADVNSCFWRSLLF